MVLSKTLVYFLSFVADIYTPLLLIVALFSIVIQWKQRRKWLGLYLVYAVFVVYIWMFVDKYCQLWARAGLDYSTHTAAALALVIFISLYKNLRVKLVLAASLLLYCYLMFVLEYHTWADMVTTAIVVGVCLWPLFAVNENIELKRQMLNE